MATLQDSILLTINKAKCSAACQASKLIDKQKAGEDITCCEKDLFVFIELIDITSRTFCKYFGVNGNLSPTDPCFTATELNNLVAKLKKYMA